MASAATKAIGGYLAGQKSSLLEEERVKRNAREESITAKERRITAYRGSIDPSRPAAGQEGYLGLAREDPAAAKATADAYSPIFEQHKDQLSNAWRTTRAMPVAQRAEQSQRLIAAAVNMRVTDEATADQLSTMAQNDPEAFSGVMDQLFGTADKATKITGDYKTYQYKDDPSKTIVLNEADPRDQDVLRKNRGNLIPAPGRQETRTGTGSFNTSKAEDEKRRDRETGVRVALATANDLVTRLEENPDLLQSASSVAQFAAGLGSEVRSAARIAGVDIPENVQDIAAYEDTFSELGIENTQAKGLAFDLALSYAAASGLGSGRALTNKDIDLALRRIAVNGINTPAARIAAIKDVARILDRNFRIDYKVREGREFEGGLGLRGGGEQASQEQQFREGQIVQQAGVKYKYTNGQFVEQ